MQRLKRLVLLTVTTGLIALLLSACGNQAEKKAETKATNQTVEQSNEKPSNAQQ